jgi:hypothetical protein
MLTSIAKIMLQGLQSQADREFFIFLTRLQDRFGSNLVATQFWWDDWQQLKQCYESKMVGAIADNIDLDSRERTLRTEIHRSVKLLEMDLLFLRSAKQKVTQQRRIAAIVSRLERLNGYCKIILPAE